MLKPDEMIVYGSFYCSTRLTFRIKFRNFCHLLNQTKNFRIFNITKETNHFRIFHPTGRRLVRRHRSGDQIQREGSAKLDS